MLGSYFCISRAFGNSSLSKSNEFTELDVEFINNVYDKMLTVCSTPRFMIERDYTHVPEHLNIQFIKKTLRKMIKNNVVCDGYVVLWVSSERVLNWTIDYKKDRY